jgi:aminopeptidase N
MTQSYMVSDYPAYFHYAYDRPGAAYYLLKQMVGEKSFIRALGAFMERWEGKHPTPYDFFFTFEDVLNRDLSWFWEPWFFDFGYPDLAIEDVKNTNNGHHITIEQKGKLPVPVDLTVWLDNGSTKEFNKSPAVWKNRDHYEVTLDSDQPIDSIKLEHQTVPDVYPENNQYRAQR